MQGPVCDWLLTQGTGDPSASGVRMGSDRPSPFSLFPDSGLGWQTAANRTCQGDGHGAKVPWGDEHHRLPQNLGVSVALASKRDFLSRHLGPKVKGLNDYGRDTGQ